MAGLREHKRERTRRALVDAALALFAEHGYERTTIADVAAAAEIAPRTFFSYFGSKEELVFTDFEARIRAATDAVDDRGPGERPADVLLRALGRVVGSGHDFVSPAGELRRHLVETVPAIRGRALGVQAEAEARIAARLAEAYPDELDAVSAGALVGAFVGAVNGAVRVLLAQRRPEDDPGELNQKLQAATDLALRPWLRSSRGSA